MISIYTPTHNPQFLNDAYQSLLIQTYNDWQWVILLNNGAEWECKDPRVKILYAKPQLKNIGALKRRAVECCDGEYLLELDHDDFLHPEALEQTVKAFEENSNIVFVYSNTSQVNEDGNPNFDTFDITHGWNYTEDDGYLECHSFSSHPHNISFIWYAPNHLRAFTKEAYDKTLGYDESLDLIDDQDIISKLYRVGEFYHLDKVLYYQRVWHGNSQKEMDRNRNIQTKTIEMYHSNIEKNMLIWCERNNLVALDLGAAHNKAEGYLGVDLYPNPGVDLVGDIFEVLEQMPNDSVGVIRANDFLEHIPDKIKLFNEMYRVLCHGGMLLSYTPSSDGRGAFQDPTHVSFYNENSFWYYTQMGFRQYVPEIQCRFQSSRITTFFPSGWHQQNNISYVIANLIAIKDGERFAGQLWI